MRPHFTWRLQSRSLELGPRTLVMGILNVTPDSFSDGGQFLSPEVAIVRALQMLDEGADILDIGGESTRPGKHEPVSAEQELERVLPVIAGILKKHPEAIISIDTYKSRVAEKAVGAGAQIVNDVSGFQWDSNMADIVAGLGCGAVIMHLRGTPATWRTLPPAEDIVKTVLQGLSYQAATAIKFGVGREAIVLDPGFGFGKNFEENYPLLAGFAKLQSMGFPLLSGTSRKSFIGKTVSGDGTLASADQRLSGSLAAMTASILAGAHIVRVHDVKASVEAARVTDAILAAENVATKTMA